MKIFLLGMLTMYLATSIITLLIGSFTKMCEDTFLEYVRNDRFMCGANKPDYVEITIRKTYVIPL